MSMYTDWFLAEESEAEDIASIASEEGRDFEDWPHLSLKSVGEIELQQLLALLLPSSDEAVGSTGIPLHVAEDEDGGGVLVARVLPEFVDALAAVTEDVVAEVAGEWGSGEEMADWEQETLISILGEIIAFAHQARQEGKPIFQFATW